MFPKINPSATQSWKELGQHASEMKKIHMKQLFAQDPDRYKKFAFTFNNTLVDFSKNILTEKTLETGRRMQTKGCYRSHV